MYGKKRQYCDRERFVQDKNDRNTVEDHAKNTADKGDQYHADQQISFCLQLFPVHDGMDQTEDGK